ncbi:hypothetical protein NFI96_018974, partial [Prochilodus magdalenae]
EGLQCYACNIVQGQRYVDVGCSSPEVITCSHSHKGFKQRFCIRTESITLGIVLTSGCATSRHCHTEELPAIKVPFGRFFILNRGGGEVTSGFLKVERTIFPRLQGTWALNLHSYVPTEFQLRCLNPAQKS